MKKIARIPANPANAAFFGISPATRTAIITPTANTIFIARQDNSKNSRHSKRFKTVSFRKKANSTASSENKIIK